MASILHVAVGLAAGRLLAGRRPAGRAMALQVGLSMLPDIDVLAFSLGIPYHHPYGHRGFTHSIVFAAAIGLVTGLVALWPLPARRAAWTGLLSFLVVLSHPLLDALTNGGLGVALFWPWEEGRYFFSWRPIPVAPIGMGFASDRGLEVALAELLPSLPFAAWALWPRRRTRSTSIAETSGAGGATAEEAD